MSVEERNAIEQALLFITLMFARRRALVETERRFAAEAIELVMAGDPLEDLAISRLSVLGLDFAQPLFALVCQVSLPEQTLGLLERALRLNRIRSTVTTKGTEVVAIAAAPDSEDELAEAIDAACRMIAQELKVAPAIGVGEKARSVAGLRRSLIEARFASSVARAQDNGGWASHVEVGSHLLLLELQNTELVEHFRDAVLQPLLDFDAQSRVSLIDTLNAFLKSGGKWSDTANTLSIHVNTLRHRLSLVEELTGRDLSGTSDRVDFYVALHALRARSLSHAPR